MARSIQIQRHSSSPTGLSGGCAKPIFDHGHVKSAKRQGERGLMLRLWSSNLPYRSRREEFRRRQRRKKSVRVRSILRRRFLAPDQRHRVFRSIRGSIEISRSVRSGEKPKIAEVNLLGLTGDLDGTLTPQVVKTIETCSPKSSRLEGQSTQEEEAVDSVTAPSMHWASPQQKASCSSPSDQQAAAPLTKGDLLIVAFVSSLWLWAATWALTSAALR